MLEWFAWAFCYKRVPDLDAQELAQLEGFLDAIDDRWQLGIPPGD